MRKNARANCVRLPQTRAATGIRFPQFFFHEIWKSWKTAFFRPVFSPARDRENLFEAGMRPAEGELFLPKRPCAARRYGKPPGGSLFFHRFSKAVLRAVSRLGCLFHGFHRLYYYYYLYKYHHLHSEVKP